MISFRLGQFRIRQTAYIVNSLSFRCVRHSLSLIQYRWSTFGNDYVMKLTQNFSDPLELEIIVRDELIIFGHFCDNLMCMQSLIAFCCTLPLIIGLLIHLSNNVIHTNVNNICTFRHNYVEWLKCSWFQC